MRILVCLPSLNEAATIASVTRVVDAGVQAVLKRYGGSGLIVNVDSRSSDGTREVFNSVTTATRKLSLVPTGTRGKGRNLLAFASLAENENADFCVTLDTDVTSASSEWVEKLLAPLIEERFDFSAPLYARSRFEGSSTNHFAYPVVYGFTGLPLRQPIAGDFALNRKALSCLSSAIPTESTCGYGIDIFMSLAVTTRGLRISQVELGTKLHNPSFNKLELMFPQIASSALALMQQVGTVCQYVAASDGKPNILPSVRFPHKTVAAQMLSRAKITIEKGGYATSPDTWLPNVLRSEILASITDSGHRELAYSRKVWGDVLESWFTFGLSRPGVDAERLGKELLPFFVVRAVGFWFSSESLTADETESQILVQAEEIKDRLGRLVINPAT